MEINLKKLRQGISRNNGFSIIEILVSVTIFSVIVISVGTIFTQILALQRRGSGAQKVQENVLFALELMAREIRVSSIENQDANCNRSDLFIVHPENGDVEYSLSGGSIQRGSGGSRPESITSNEVEFTRLNFCIEGTEVVGGVGDRKQAKVTIIVQVRNRANRTQDVVTFDLQTTVVSRDNDIEFTN